jgi:mRNA interferase MazF
MPRQNLPRHFVISPITEYTVIKSADRQKNSPVKKFLCPGCLELTALWKNRSVIPKKWRVRKVSVKRGDIYYADLSPVVGSEQGGLRPVLIVQNDIGNKYSPTVIAAAITSRMGKTKLPTHIDIYADKAGLAKDSVVLLEQIRTIDKRRLKEKIGHLDDGMMNTVNNAISISFGLGDNTVPEAISVREQSSALM